MTEEIESHIIQKYEVLQKMGKGAYGVVWKAIDRKTKQIVALKKVFDAFHNATDAQRTFREVMFLQEMAHDNVIRMTNIHRADNNKDLYIVFDFMETDLHAVIRGGILEEIHQRYIIYQILKALKYIHSAEIIHRDLKPSNVLLDAECNVKVADFGLARSLLNQVEESAILTEYVATRWYRAPEILLGSTQYTKAVDMWSVGCILGEMINGKPIFPGSSTLNQIERVLEVIGRPTTSELESVQAPMASQIVNNIPKGQRIGFTNYFPKATPQALDLIRRLLSFNPSQRISVEEALKHPYVGAFHHNNQEGTTNPIIISMDDNKKFSIKEYREALYLQISKKYETKFENKFETKYENKFENSFKNIEQNQQERKRTQSFQQASKKPNAPSNSTLTNEQNIIKQQDPNTQHVSQNYLKEYLSNCSKDYLGQQQSQQNVNMSKEFISGQLGKEINKENYKSKNLADVSINKMERDNSISKKQIISPWTQANQKPQTATQQQRPPSVSVYTTMNQASSNQLKSQIPQQINNNVCAAQKRISTKMPTSGTSTSFYVPPDKNNSSFNYGKKISKDNSFLGDHNTSTQSNIPQPMHQKTVSMNYQTYLMQKGISDQRSKQHLVNHQRTQSSLGANNSVLINRCKEFLQNIQAIKK
ncbi:unnamed protein product (macronuclear) [Paramecium tetraurelia]|uniref:Protein kinase domain-containing protein n=1 Tax=Paramecium tetraurelia TaxID=5888 RepID=A0DX76_PARTE|nr:uncharacterized protein GSPATT00021275001 [Paramecium tetraurelia]CAK87643.1 unnamed protein product [Paramecium tetraurelia]|eukprot:XP_001455040.1 hypothetical protein (macronuclear) [Paramecium tetraurelia strain d4-2]